MLYLYNAMFGSIGVDCVISELCYKGVNLLKKLENYHFMVKFQGQKFGSHNMTLLYPTLAYLPLSSYAYA